MTAVPPTTVSAGARFRALAPILLDLIVPTIGYFVLHWFGLSDVWALTVAGSASGVAALVNTVRRRHVDVLGVLVAVELAVSVALAVITADARLVLVRPAFYLAVAAAVGLASVTFGRPLTYTAATPLATKGDPQRTAAYERAWHRSARLRQIHRRLTAAVSLGMLAYAVLRVVVVYSFSVGSAVLLQEVPGIVLIVGALALLRSQVPELRRIVDAEQAATVQSGSAGLGDRSGGDVGVNLGE
jgi:hypothetical protein